MNERYRSVADTVEPATGVEVTVERPPSFDADWLWVLAPGRAPAEIAYRTDGDSIRFTLPNVDVYSVALFASELPEP